MDTNKFNPYVGLRMMLLGFFKARVFLVHILVPHLLNIMIIYFVVTCIVWRHLCFTASSVSAPEPIQEPNQRQERVSPGLSALPPIGHRRNMANGPEIKKQGSPPHRTRITGLLSMFLVDSSMKGLSILDLGVVLSMLKRRQQIKLISATQ